MMVQNLERRGCPLLGLPDCPELADQRRRFEQCGWSGAHAVDMNEAYGLIDAAERTRVERLERFDEVEEWQLISSHYCVSWAHRLAPVAAGPHAALASLAPP